MAVVNRGAGWPCLANFVIDYDVGRVFDASLPWCCQLFLRGGKGECMDKPLKNEDSMNRICKTFPCRG